MGMCYHLVQAVGKDGVNRMIYCDRYPMLCEYEGEGKNPYDCPSFRLDDEDYSDYEDSEEEEDEEDEE